MLCMWGESAFRDGHTINFIMEPEVFGYSRKTFILGSDVRRLASMREVFGNCIAVYQRYLYDQLTAYKMVDMVAFVDPSRIGGKGGGNGTVRAQHIRDRLLTAKPGQIFMLPYNSGAFGMFNAERKKKGRSSVIWKNLAGIPPQPSNKECGYFVMRYMRDIIEDKDLSLFATKWERRGSSQYTQEDIDQLRNEWAKFVVKTYV
ncbi:putative Ulp1 protease family catalytic domain-containing protein [Rosa chinensis]|uniref:Putative Ulp1 protease family catalytic domain-containing protein n=1 Tax=Rosa chinensis TaxID=74649 RepID=A0A2P6QKH5_ROSCH|nr:putative Ulp1 protease family catalytic domain-containing protein [Rosa chinensis]